MIGSSIYDGSEVRRSFHETPTLGLPAACPPAPTPRKSTRTKDLNMFEHSVPNLNVLSSHLEVPPDFIDLPYSWS